MEEHRARSAADERGEMTAEETAASPEEAVVSEPSVAPATAGEAATAPAAGVPADDATRPTRALEGEREKYLRLAAEFDNFRKRSARERQEAGWRAQGDLVQGLIEVFDDIMRFAHLDPASTDAATVVQGVAMVERKLFKTLAGHGLEIVNPVDAPFDPAFHEAVSTEPALSREDDHLVARVYQPGYVFRGQLLRPARVVVRQWLG